jgi:hypothetical protein
VASEGVWGEGVAFVVGAAVADVPVVGEASASGAEVAVGSLSVAGAPQAAITKLSNITHTRRLLDKDRRGIKTSCSGQLTSSRRVMYSREAKRMLVGWLPVLFF